jgi:uncharacterized protein YneF (UPF0154 family)
MNISLYLAIGFILGVITTLMIGFYEIVGKVNKKQLKEFFEILLGEE